MLVLDLGTNDITGLGASVQSMGMGMSALCPKWFGGTLLSSMPSHLLLLAHAEFRDKAVKPFWRLHLPLHMESRDLDGVGREQPPSVITASFLSLVHGTYLTVVFSGSPREMV